MIGGLNPFKWHRVVREVIAAHTGTDTARDIFMIQPVNIFHTFAARLTSFTGGTIVLKCRFHLTTPPAVIAGHGFDFPILAAADTTVVANVAAANGLAAPNVQGNPNLILPPVGRVYSTTAAFTGTFEVWAAYLGGA